MLQVKSYKSRTPATPRDTKARGKDSRKKLLLGEQVERERERKAELCAGERKEKAENGKIGSGGERHASAPIYW